MSKTTPIKSSDFLSDLELCRLYDWIRKHETEDAWYDRCFLVRLVLGTGMRVGEIGREVINGEENKSGLQVVDCHLAEKYQGATIHPEYVRIREAESKNGRERIINIMPELRPHYLARLDWCSERESPWVFPRSDNPDIPMSHRAIKLWWNEALQAAGIRHLSIHCGRKTYATWEARRYLETCHLPLYERQGLDAHQLKSQLGHTRCEMTERYYQAPVASRVYNTSPILWPAHV